jgi:hypothetical protein
MYTLLTKPTDPALVLSDMECIAIALRYPDIMFPKQKVTGYVCGALRLGKDISNIRHAVSDLTANEYNKRLLTVKNDVQSNIIDFSKPLNGLQGKGDAIRSRELDPVTKTFKIAASVGLGTTTITNLATTLNDLYNETITKTGATNFNGLSLPPFVFVLVDGEHLNTQLDYQYVEATLRGFKNNVNVPGYVCLGDVFVLNNETIPLGNEMYTVTSPVLLMYARQELCLVGTGSDVGGVYMLKTDNPLYRPMGVFTSSQNNVAVLKCAFKETLDSQPALQFSAFNTHRLDVRCNNANYKVLPGSETAVECRRSYREIIENLITSSIDVLENRALQANNSTVGGLYSMPGDYSDIRTFYTSLCAKNPTIAGFYNMCDCIKPRNTTLDSFRNALGIKDRPNQIVSFACNTKACVERDKKTVIHFGDACPTTKPRLCIDAIKSITAPDTILSNVCYNCYDLTSTCISNAPIIKETGGLEKVVCGKKPDGTELLCGSSDCAKMTYAAPDVKVYKATPVNKTAIIVIMVVLFIIIAAIIYLRCINK